MPISRRLCAAVLAAGLLVPLGLPLRALAADGGVSVRSDGLRDRRYCELIVVQRKSLALMATVYNTLGLNDCPVALWDRLTEARVRQVFDAPEVVLNGPRYWVLDTIKADGATAAGETVTVDGLGLTARATLDLNLFDLRSSPYSERRIERSTQWVYDAGKPMFILQGPDGARYAMQSYAQIVDPELAYDDLEDLGSLLSLPAGWAYSVFIPGRQVSYPSGGQAVVVQDEFDNTYQKLP